jgi:hypothetical protein
MFLSTDMTYIHTNTTALSSQINWWGKVDINLLKPSGNFTYEQV